MWVENHLSFFLFRHPTLRWVLYVDDLICDLYYYWKGRYSCDHHYRGGPWLQPLLRITGLEGDRSRIRSRVPPGLLVRPQQLPAPAEGHGSPCRSSTDAWYRAQRGSVAHPRWLVLVPKSPLSVHEKTTPHFPLSFCLQHLPMEMA